LHDGRTDEPPDAEPHDVTVAVPSMVASADPTARAMVDAAVARMEAFGCRVARGTGPEVDRGAVRRTGLLLCELVLLEVYAEAYSSGHPGLSAGLRRLLDYAAPLRGGSDIETTTRAELERLGGELRRQVEGLGVLLLPTAPGPVPLLGDDPAGAADLTAWVNVAGLPGAVLPDGWPVRLAGDRPGLQLVGGVDQDRALLVLADGLDANVSHSRR
jgi:Asp-tRNA(Asn)/Glu-tRNA(Gln) amidotransferase A subunit family amidase